MYICNLSRSILDLFYDTNKLLDKLVYELLKSRDRDIDFFSVSIKLHRKEEVVVSILCILDFKEKIKKNWAERNIVFP